MFGEWAVVLAVFLLGCQGEADLGRRDASMPIDAASDTLPDLTRRDAGSESPVGCPCMTDGGCGCVDDIARSCRAIGEIFRFQNHDGSDCGTCWCRSGPRGPEIWCTTPACLEPDCVLDDGGICATRWDCSGFQTCGCACASEDGGAPLACSERDSGCD